MLRFKYDLLCSKIGSIETSEEIKKIVKEILGELGPYVRVSDWNKKESIRAKIKDDSKKIIDKEG